MGPLCLSRANISKNSVANMYYYHGKELKNKCGPKFNISKFEKLRIKREIVNLKKGNEKINSSKIKKSCYLRISIRYLKCEEFKHSKSEIPNNIVRKT